MIERRELIKEWMAWKSKHDNISYTYKALADDAGLNPNYLSNVMTGLRNPGVKTLKRIADAFGVSMSEFFNGPSDDVMNHTVDTSSTTVSYLSKISDTDESDSGSSDFERSSVQNEKTEKFGLKFTKDGAEGFDRLFSSYGFESGSVIPVTDEKDIEKASRNTVKTGENVSEKAANDTVIAPVTHKHETAEIPDTISSGHNESADVIVTDADNTVPLINSVFEGDLKEWVDNYNKGNGEYDAISRFHAAEGDYVFAYRMDDDSMSPEIEKGDILYVNPEHEFTKTNGGIALVRHDGILTLRRIFGKGENWHLVPVNPRYGPDVISKSAAELMKIVLWIPGIDEKF